MESDTLQAPPVVAVVVVHEPGPWFDETLDSFAAQDYPNLRFLFLHTGDDDGATAEVIRSRLPGAFVRELGDNPGFGVAVNEVLHLVEGDNGLFLICHDDIALEPSSLRVLVEELYRSNAGVVGPKLVEWDDPSVLQSVGLGLDRFGEVDHIVEEGEVDQEQHDGVRDVFVMPSACMLVRADLFREVDGFDRAIDYHGDDVELCWRVHHSGARVVVAPSARVRHVGDLAGRRPDLNHRKLRARHRMRSVATLTGAARLPGRSLELVLLTLVELVLGLFTGRLGQAWASLRALGGLIPRTGSLVARRRAVRPLRHVPEREVFGLQERGSARLNGFLRSRETATYVGAEASVRRWRESTTAPVIAWIVVIAGLIVGSRELLRGGVPPVGEFLLFPQSPRLLLDSYLSGFDGTGAGATSPTPTGWATLAGLSVTTLFRMGLLHTLSIIGLVLIGIGGMWKLATVFPSTRARIGALLVYAASPLVGGALSGGQLTVLVVYAASPWVVHLLRRAVGVAAADPQTATLDIADGLVQISWLERLRRSIVAGIVVAVAAAFAPISLVVAFVLGILLALGTLLALAPWRTALGYLFAGTVATAVGALLNLPWLVTWTWDDLVGAPPIGNPGRGLLEVASFDIGAVEFAVLSLALYIPVVAAIALARAWRLTWAVRAGVLVVTFGGLAVLADRDALPFRAPEAGVLLVPVAIGVALSSAAALAAFDLDVRGGSFGWRQPLGIVSSIAVVVALVPGVLAIGEGNWQMPTTPLSQLLDASLPSGDEDGDYNVLLLGDARVLPVPSEEYRDGLSWAIMNEDGLDTRDRWAPPPNDTADAIASALDDVASSSTLRAGRLLAPLGIRYIVVPEFDGVVSTADDPIPPPAGLFEDLDDQLDLVSITGLPTIDAIPPMVRDLATSMSLGQQVVGMFMAGLAIGQLPAGLISDRIGRMPVLYAGIGLFTVAGVVTSVSGDINILLAARFVQGIGSSAGMVLSRAIVRDISSGTEAARIMSFMVMVFTIAPMVAPLLGSWLVTGWGWRMPFAATAVAGLLIIAGIKTSLRETRARTVAQHPGRQLWNSLQEFFSHRQSIFGVAIIVATMGGIMAIISGSAALIIEIYAYPVGYFGLIFAMTGVFILIGSTINRHLLLRMNALQVIGIGAAIAGIAGAQFLIIAILGHAPFWWIWACVCLFMTSTGFLMPNATALALDPVPQVAGVAASLIGTIQSAAGATSAIVSSMLYTGTILNFTLVVGLAGVLSALVYIGRRWIVGDTPLYVHKD